MNDFSFRINEGDAADAVTVTVRILRCGEEICRPDKHPAEGLRDYYSLHVVKSGRGHLRHSPAGEPTMLKGGDVFLLYPGEPILYGPDSTHPWTYAWVDFDGEGLDSLMTACGLNRGCPMVRLTHPERLNPLITGLLSDFETDGAGGLACMAAFIMLLSELMREKKQTDDGGSMSGRMGKLRRALMYIDCNYTLPLRVEEIARSALVSPDYLQHLFSDLVGMSVTSYINRLRVSMACEWLHEGSHLQITQIAHMVGFGDERYFARIFRRWTGMTARAYRAAEPEEDTFAWLKQKGLNYKGYLAKPPETINPDGGNDK